MISTLCCRSILNLSRTIKYQTKNVVKIRLPVERLQLTSAKQNHVRYLATQNPQTEAADKPYQVYYGALTPQIRMVKIFSLATSATGLLFQPMLIQKSAMVGGVPMLALAVGIVGFFTFVTPILLHLVCKKYVTTMDFDPHKGQYTAITFSFFMRKQKTIFTPEQVKVPDVPGMFTSIIANETPLFIDPRMFPNPDHYVKIMGYDKPMDFKLGLDEANTEENVKGQKK